MDLLYIILSLTGFLRNVGIIVVVYYVIKFLGRLLFPVVMKKAVNNMQEKQSQYQRHNQYKQEGEVTVETKNRQQSNNVGGEYVDFEEIE